MKILILEADAHSFFTEADKLETKDSKGRWRYCKFLNLDQVFGLFETEKNIDGSFEVHDDFFKFFLGLFTPQAKEKMEICQEESFKSFCVKLNDLLLEHKDIYDLSVQNKWIWTEGENTKVPEKLLAFLDFK